MKSSKKIGLTLLHLYIIISTILLTFHGVLYGAEDAQPGESMIYLGFFKAYTNDSNILAGIGSLIISIYLILCLKKKREKVPYWAILLQYTGAVGVGLTFLVTATFLVPSFISQGKNFWSLYQGRLFFLHIVNPICAILAFALTNEDYTYTKKENLIGISSMIIYGIVYYICVAITRIWTDFYGFTFGGHYKIALIVFVIVFGITYLIGHLIILLNKALN